MTWLEVLRVYWPIWVALFAAIGAVGELRTRKMLDARDEAWKKDMKEWKEERDAEWKAEREDLQKPIGGIGNTALEALTKCRDHEPRLIELETKTAVFWKMIERSTAGLLRNNKGGEES